MVGSNVLGNEWLFSIKEKEEYEEYAEKTGGL